jgi:hypothetical protein
MKPVRCILACFGALSLILIAWGGPQAVGAQNHEIAIPSLLPVVDWRVVTSLENVTGFEMSFGTNNETADFFCDDVDVDFMGYEYDNILFNSVLGGVTVTGDTQFSTNIRAFSDQQQHVQEDITRENAVPDDPNHNTFQPGSLQMRRLGTIVRPGFKGCFTWYYNSWYFRNTQRRGWGSFRCNGGPPVRKVIVARENYHVPISSNSCDASSTSPACVRTTTRLANQSGKGCSYQVINWNCSGGICEPQNSCTGTVAPGSTATTCGLEGPGSGYQELEINGGCSASSTYQVYTRQSSPAGAPVEVLVGEAGIGLPDPATLTVIPVTKTVSGEDTGIAMVPVLPFDTQVVLELLQSDSVVATVELLIPAGTNVSRFFLEYFEMQDTVTQFDGAVRIRSDVDLSTIALNTLNGFPTSSLPGN